MIALCVMVYNRSSTRAATETGEPVFERLTSRGEVRDGAVRMRRFVLGLGLTTTFGNNFRRVLLPRELRMLVVDRDFLRGVAGTFVVLLLRAAFGVLGVAPGMWSNPRCPLDGSTRPTKRPVSLVLNRRSLKNRIVSKSSRDRRTLSISTFVTEG